MFTGEDVVRTARTYIGTPWVQTGRKKGKDFGVDCVGLVICTFNELGLPIPMHEDYSLDDEFTKLVERVEMHCFKVENEEFLPGDILLFRARMMHNHAAFYSGEKTIIHAYNGDVRMVLEEPFSPSWKVRLYAAYRVRELA